MRTMNASEAKAITTKSLAAAVAVETEGYIAQIDHQIRDLAREGKSVLNNPYRNLKKDGRVALLSSGVKSIVESHYRRHGFVWTNHLDPDPGHPCSFSYITLSW